MNDCARDRRGAMDSMYHEVMRSGELARRVAASADMLRCCRLCPRRCGVDRLSGERGYCGGGDLAEVASYGPHFGEESVLVGSHGSGTIFFCGCNLLCRFCQNYSISHHQESDCVSVSPVELAAIMVDLQGKGCHNINLVTPSHLVPQILAALPTAIENGLHLPLVYNCGGYESVETLRLLDGVIDIYMPDAKFWDVDSARKWLDAEDYPEVMRMALKEMQRQVGDLSIADTGIAGRGLLVRHLLMPGGLEETRQILLYLATTISKQCYVNIMDQYRPCGEASAFPELNTGLQPQMLAMAVQIAEQAGLSRLDRKDISSLLRQLFSR